MNALQLKQVPVMKTGMLIRKPPRDVFEAFADPAITTKFWFTHGSGRLEAGRQVTWEWRMYDISIAVAVKAFEPHKRIVIEWPGHKGLTQVEWKFTPWIEASTFVDVMESGFSGDGDELIAQVSDSTQGFSLVLAGAKALLEHGIQLNLVPDRYPKGITSHQS